MYIYQCLGVDDVFVFINTFRQAYYLTNIGDRMIHTTWTAGKATFFTSFTTAAAFAANVASSVSYLLVVAQCNFVNLAMNIVMIEENHVFFRFLLYMTLVCSCRWW